MADLSDEKWKEMEAEMDRFEEEISAPNFGIDDKVIIGAGTYDQVQARLDKKEPINYGGLAPPPPPPSGGQTTAPQGPQLPRDYTRAPPPPPPSQPAFMPPQLRHRAPPGPPSGPPRMRPPPPPPPTNRPMGPPPMGHPRGPPMGGGPPMMPPQRGPYQGPPGPPGPPPGGPPGPPHGGPPHRHPGPPGHHQPGPPGMPPPRGMGPPHRPNAPPGYYSQGPQIHKPPEIRKPAVLEAPKVVYSSPPVKSEATLQMEQEKRDKKRKRKKQRIESAEGEEREPGAAGGGTQEDVDGVAMETTSTQDVAPGIELNVPVEPIIDPGYAEAMALAESSQPIAKKEKREKKKKFVRMAAGQVWEDPTLSEWDTDDFRMFCGDLGNEVTDETLTRVFSKFTTFQRAKVVRDKKTNKSKGYGFVSFRDPNDFARAMREMNGKYVGNRPIKLRKSTWKDRQIDVVKKKDKEKKRLGFR